MAVKYIVFDLQERGANGVSGESVPNNVTAVLWYVRVHATSLLALVTSCHTSRATNIPVHKMACGCRGERGQPAVFHAVEELSSGKGGATVHMAEEGHVSEVTSTT